MRTIYFLLLAFITATSYADEEFGERGFVLEVSVSGFFSPEVEEAVVVSVEEDSSAKQHGVTIDDKLVAIFDCKIPGCPAKKAKGLMQKKSGETLNLTFEKPDGNQYTADVTLK